MTTLIVFICVALLLLIVLQIARVRDLAKQLRGAEEVEARNTNMTGIYLVAFMVVFLVLATASAFYYKNLMLGYGPNASASEHGYRIDAMMNWTLLVTYTVFIITHVLLFWYAYSYRAKKGRKAQFISHNNTLEIIWTGIPAIVMTFLVIGGLDAWNDIMGDVGTDEEVLEIEATGFQFGWHLRYPGPDGLLGKKDFRSIEGGVNPLGQIWTDPKNVDDVHATELVLPVGQKIRVRITAQDVLHDFYLPQFRVKMDAVPGLPTYFVFTPNKTTKQWRKELSKYPEYQVPDPNDPTKMLWETRDFELACAELCGKGHWSMLKRVTVLEEDEYAEWAAKQPSYFMTNIRGTEDDPYTDQLFPAEITQRSQEFNTEANTALETASDDDNTLVLKYVTFETGSDKLTELSRYQLDDAIAFLKKNSDVTSQLRGHTDNTGDATANQELSERRAAAVLNYLVKGGIAADRLRSVGYGASSPIEDNATEEGRQANRRTEFYITRSAAPASEPSK
ncbi:OmpA family protein [Neolewinella lacunae]|uniref:Cytochrome c oxidase subunit 2 n=1 Tax=Neolewinella lacunae TaxID=1517758 RepID=A0A923PS83_9BACT|nr:OmpA family protein [Neolewinella lacunae]MBC6996544.1 OmpA family protein [Neolewinella lacunae]MDN3634891.1 OmpA family protein [Neolewinella lacunae]